MVESLPADYLALIPEILSEAVLGTKEVNEKARDAGFDLLVAMGHKMAKGGTVTRMTAGPGDGEDEDEDAVGQEGMSSPLSTDALAWLGGNKTDIQKRSRRTLRSMLRW